eukprot:SAG11_NODE_1425_length_4944_cov_3.856966_5_plen_160_part_00
MQSTSQQPLIAAEVANAFLPVNLLTCKAPPACPLVLANEHYQVKRRTTVLMILRHMQNHEMVAAWHGWRAHFLEWKRLATLCAKVVGWLMHQRCRSALSSWLELVQLAHRTNWCTLLPPAPTHTLVHLSKSHSWISMLGEIGSPSAAGFMGGLKYCHVI